MVIGLPVRRNTFSMFARGATSTNVAGDATRPEGILGIVGAGPAEVLVPVTVTVCAPA